MDRARPTSPEPADARRGSAGPVALVWLVVTGLLALLAGPVAAQGTDVDPGAAEAGDVTVPADPPGTPFPAQLVATLPAPADATPPALALTGFYAVPGEEAGRPTVVLRFAAPFELPDEPWRASVALGDPTGEHLRVSLQARGASTAGVVERVVAGSATALASTEASFQPSGLVLLEVPLDDVPEGGAAWAEVALDDGGADEAVIGSPWYPQAAVLGTGDPGIVPSSTLGRVTGAVDGPDAVTAGDDASTPLDLGPGPWLGLAPRPDDPSARSVVLVTWDAPPPVEVDGSPVVEVVDLVRIAPDDVGDAVATPYVSVERSTGAVTLVEGRAWPLEDRSGDRGWYLDGSTTFGVDGLEVLALDLDAALAALGDDVPRESVALGLTRTLRLEDGRHVVADGVLGTTAWLDQAAGLTVPTTAAPVPPSTVASRLDPDTGELTFLGWLALTLIVVGWLAALRTVRQRRRERRLVEAAAAAEAAAAEPEDDRPWWERSRVRTTPVAADPAPVAEGPATEGPAGEAGAGALPIDERGAAVVVTVEDLRRPSPGDGAPPPGAPSGEPRHRPTGVTIDAALATELAEPAEAPPPGDAEPGADVPAEDLGPEPVDEAAPDEALTTLSHDLSELTERLRRLEGDGPGD